MKLRNRGFEPEPPPSEYEEKAPWMAPAGGEGGLEEANRMTLHRRRR